MEPAGSKHSGDSLCIMLFRTCRCLQGHFFSEAVFEHDLTCGVMNDVFPELAVPQVLACRRSR